MTVNPIPQGYTSLTPFLVVDGAAKAIEFYTTVFGATVIETMAASDGSVAHAELDFGNGRLQLSDYQLEAVVPRDAVTHSMVLYCPDVDAVETRAKEAGATIREPAQTFVTGDRFASIVDPFGQPWAVMTRVEDVDAGERDRRLAEWASQNV
jgi:PhnB protein